MCGNTEPVIVEVGGIRYRRHANGGGLVAETATVASRVFVGCEARITGNATVRGDVRLYGETEIGDNANVYGQYGAIILRHRYRIGGDIELTNRSFVDCELFGDQNLVADPPQADDEPIRRHWYIHEGCLARGM